jgi:hypothetical protein
MGNVYEKSVEFSKKKLKLKLVKEFIFVFPVNRPLSYAEVLGRGWGNKC